MADEIFVKVPQKLIQDIANYLVTRPWQEVNGLIAGMSQQAVPIPPEIKPDL